MARERERVCACRPERGARTGARPGSRAGREHGPSALGRVREWGRGGRRRRGREEKEKEKKWGKGKKKKGKGREKKKKREGDRSGADRGGRSRVADRQPGGAG